MNKKILIEICGDLDFEGMVVDISCGNQIIAEINYEKGIDNMEIEIASSEDPSRIFPLDGFFKILEGAKQLAIKCANGDAKTSLQ